METGRSGRGRIDLETELEGGKMGKARNPFRGIVDTMSEMARMREYAEGGGQGEGPRTHATA